MLKLYCYESLGYILRRSSDTRSDMRRIFWVWADFPSTGPQALNYFKQHGLSFFSSATGTPGFKKCAACRFRILFHQLLANFRSGCFGSFSESRITEVFRLVALKICYVGHVIVYFLHCLSKPLACGSWFTNSSSVLPTSQVVYQLLLFKFHTLHEFRSSDWLICTTWHWVMTKQLPWRHYRGVIAVV